MPQARIVNYHGFQLKYCPEAGYTPIFTNLVVARIHQKMACNVVFTGDAGVGKSYMAMDIARVVEGKIKGSRKERFTIDQVVFTYTDFMELVQTLAPGKIIVFDEPSYSMGKRDWYKDLNKALVQTIESFRFKMHPLFIPIINIALLDKTIRDYLINFQVVVRGRGRGEAYRLMPGQFEEKIWHEHLCKLKLGLFDRDKCSRQSCLDCKKLMEKNSEVYACNIFRAEYERKKASIQEVRYDQALDMAEKKETQQLTDQQIENLAFSILGKLLDENGKIDVQAMRIHLQDSYGIRLSNNKGYKIRRMLELHHPESISA